MTLEPEAPEPVRHRIKEERIRFYLDNFKVIETWAQLRVEANEALHELFLDMVDTLAEDAIERDSPDVDVRLDDFTNSRKPRIVLTRRSWQDANGHVPAAIAIEWHRPPIDKTGELYFYVGVRVGDRGSRDLHVAKHLSGLAPALRSRLGSPWERESESFPVWRWITPQGDGLDETALVNEARSAAWTCWEACAQHIDDVLA
jgi:hypothetical protein